MPLYVIALLAMDCCAKTSRCKEAETSQSSVHENRRETEWIPAASGCGQTLGEDPGEGKWPAMPTHESARQIG